MPYGKNSETEKEGEKEGGGGGNKELAANLEEQKQQDRREQRPKKENTMKAGLITEWICIPAGILGYP